MSKQKQDSLAQEKIPHFEEWLSNLRDSKKDQSYRPSFKELYEYRLNYNNQEGLGEPNFKQWYSAVIQLRDQTKPCHPDWFGIGTPKEYNPLCDDSLPSPSTEYEILLKKYKAESISKSKKEEE